MAAGAGGVAAAAATATVAHSYHNKEEPISRAGEEVVSFTFMEECASGLLQISLLSREDLCFWLERHPA